MSYSVQSIAVFEKQAERLVKKCALLKAELQSLKETPEQGTPVGRNSFKIRVAVASKGKGKRGGARLITNFVIADETVYLFLIYDKSEKDDLTDREIGELAYIPE